MLRNSPCKAHCISFDFTSALKSKQMLVCLKLTNDKLTVCLTKTAQKFRRGEFLPKGQKFC